MPRNRVLSRWSMVLMLALVGGACDSKKSEKVSVATEPEPELAVPPVEERDPLSIPQTRPLLYKIQGENGPVYLLGSLHVGFDAEKQLPEHVWTRLEQSEVFVMETDLSGAQLSMASKMALPKEAPSLEDQLGPALWKKLDDKLGGSADMFHRTQPWTVLSTLVMKMVPPDRMSKPMDQVLHARAKAKQLELAYLESPGEQLEILSETLDLDELKKMLEEYDTQQDELVQMLDDYREGNVEGIVEASFKDLEEKPEHYEKLFFRRNENWIPPLEKHIERGKVFVVFGAGHLYGERGVLKLLEKKGHKAERVIDAGDLETDAAVDEPPPSE